MFQKALTFCGILLLAGAVVVLTAGPSQAYGRHPNFLSRTQRLRGSELSSWRATHAAGLNGVLRAVFSTPRMGF